MLKFTQGGRARAATVLVLSLGVLTIPGETPAPSPEQAFGTSFVTLCRLYHDPHDKFTRVVPLPAPRLKTEAGAITSVITVNYGAGFTTEAQTAFQAAVDIWQTQVASTVPIVVDAQYLNLGTSGLLGIAGFRNVFQNFPGAPLANVFYPGPIANKISGVDRDGAATEIAISLNSVANWSHATDGVPVAGKPDLVSAVLHELAHGLGFAGSASINSMTGAGQLGVMGRPYTYDIFAADSANTGIVDASTYPIGSIALANLIRGTGVAGPGLFWRGQSGIAANAGVRPRLYAPSTYQVGFSYSHLDDATYPPGNVNSLMTPSLGNAEVIHTMGPVVNGMMTDMGWGGGSGGPQCSYGLSFTQANVPAAGGAVQVTLSTSAGCNWTASTASPFVTITANASGTQSAVVQMAVAANPGASARVATVQIADQTLTIAQAGTAPCGFSLTPGAAAIGGAGGTGTVTLNTAAACGWTATSNPGHATISNPSDGVESATILGVGPATINYTVRPNPACAQRTVTLSIAGQPFVITQGPAPPSMAIDKTSFRFGAVATATAFSSQTAAQTLRISQNGVGPVPWTASSSAPWLVVTPASGTGAAVVSISTQFAAGLAASQTGNVTITYSGASTASSTAAVTLTLVAPPQAAVPFGSFDTPGNLSTGLVGSVAVTGWALDDIEVTRVRIMRDPIAGEAPGQLVYIGDADLVEGARPDVQTLYLGMPRASRAGWGYLMLTNFLPNLGNGTFRITAIAEDRDGHTTVLGARTITVANASAIEPFGAIDTPAQGGVATGTLNNFGWVLSRGPRRSDPPSGGTVRVAIDGALIASVPSGWTTRSDLQALFPLAEYPGLPNALGVAAIDTTLMTNAVHTIAWVVTDNQGTASGIGSRYFTVSNDVTSTGTCTGVETGSQLTARVAPAMRWKRGYDADTPLIPLDADAGGRFTIRVEELDRIELTLAPGATGGQRVAGGLQPLPAGAQIDPVTGTFTWQPGVGFLGTFDFLLAGREIRVVIDPKSSGRVGPQVVIDVPSAGGAGVSSQGFVVAGWAADLDATIDGGVDVVHLWAYPIVDGQRAEPVFLGAAPVDGARPDVALIYGGRFGRSGYGLQVTALPPGTYDLAVFAYSTVRGGFGPAQTVRAIVR